jgi:hypothetical protein
MAVAGPSRLGQSASAPEHRIGQVVDPEIQCVICSTARGHFPA